MGLGRNSSAPGSDLRVAFVHQQLYPCHERAFIGREVEGGRSDVIRLTE
jgi:hypothetical protein